MSKKTKQAKPQGAEAFDVHYAEIYQDKWPGLKAALLRETVKVELKNPFEDNPVHIYELDPASTVVASEIDFSSGRRILDLCAAPGGKSLCMVYRAAGDIRLTCNELSLPRFKRLRSVLRDHLPEDIYASIEFKKSDGSRWGLSHKDEFDHVLLDAPCSGERHILKTPSELKQWTVKRGKGLHQRQVALICAAFDCLKPGGSLVYSTCSIHPLENDGVIEKLLKKRRTASVSPLVTTEGEATSFGRLILPVEKNWGPIYLARVSKLNELQVELG